MILSEILRYLENSGISDVSSASFCGETVTIHIRGDWKHDHARADELLKEKYGFELIGEEEDDTDGSDCYGSFHEYRVPDGMEILPF